MAVNTESQRFLVKKRIKKQRGIYSRLKRDKLPEQSGIYLMTAEVFSTPELGSPRSVREETMEGSDVQP